MGNEETRNEKREMKKRETGNDSSDRNFTQVTGILRKSLNLAHVILGRMMAEDLIDLTLSDEEENLEDTRF